MLPTIEVQRQFICLIQKVDKLKVDTQKSLDEIYNNYNALMQKAFKGELFGGE